MAESVLKLTGINKYFGSNHVIHNVNLDIRKGDFVTFLGPSGCGKTTLLRMVAGFYEPDEGQILLNGRNIEKVPPYDRNTAMVFQEYALFPTMTVFENVSYGLRVKKTAEAEVQQRVQQALELMQLIGMETRYPNQLSGGQQQRVAVARALVMQPDVLLLDEPLSNLDAKLRETVRVELREIQQKMQLTAIYVTHDQSEALSMSDMIVVMRGGFIHQIGNPQEIYFQPKTAFVADFIGTTNLLEVTLAGNAVRYMDTLIPLASDVAIDESAGRYRLSVRPESLRVTKEAPQTGEVSIPAVIKSKMFLGEKVRYFLADSSDKEWIVDAFDPGRHLLDGQVNITFHPEKAWLIQGNDPDEV